MTTQNKSAGIDVCSGPSLPRAEHLALDAARFVPAKSLTSIDQVASRPAAAE